MAVKKTYIVKSVKFTPSGGVEQTFEGVKNITITQNGQVVAQGSDDDFAITAHFAEDLEAEVSVETSDASLLSDTTNFGFGIVGSLVMTMQQRAAGKGAASGGDKVLTAGQAMVGLHNATIPRTGESGETVPFHCSDADGLDPFSWS